MARKITPKPIADSAGTIRWRVRFRHDDGRSGSRTFDDAKSAETFIGLISDAGISEALAILDELSGSRGDAYTVTDWLNEHVATKTGIQADTRKRYTSYIRNDFARWANLPVSMLTPKMVAAWVNALAESGAAAKTIANKHGLLADAMAQAHRDKLTSLNPCEQTRLPRSEVEGMVFLTHDEYASFIGYFTPFWQPLVAVMFGTGMRWGEITALQVRDVNLDEGAISISRAWKRGGELGPPKSKMSRRTISIPQEVVAELRPLVANKPTDAWVFTNTRGGPVRHQTFMENVWNPAVRLANGEPAAAGKRVGRRRDASGVEILPAERPLGKRPTPHDARHTCASWLLGAGVPINWVQAHLGHESITTTVGTYGHVMPAARSAVASAMSAAMTGAHPTLDPA